MNLLIGSVGRRCAATCWLLVLGVLIVAGPAGTAQEVAEEHVTMTVVGFSPSTVEIETGTTVLWDNANAFNYPVVDGTHELEADDGAFASPPIAPGGSWGFRFLEPGTYSYHDVRHPELTGEVVVTGDPVKPATPEENVNIVEPDPNVPESWGYEPTDIVVETGTKILWRNTGGQPHTVTADDSSFDSGTMAAGDVWTMTFDEPGAFRYHCDPHPWMTGTIRVAEAGSAPPPPPPPPPSSGSDAGGDDVDQPLARPTGSGPQTIPVAMVEPQISTPKTWTFRPNVVSVRTGDTVRWTNRGSLVHTATASDGSFDSGDVAAGGTYERTFESTGRFTYTCTPHPWMTGVVVVSDRPEEVDTDAVEVLAGGGSAGVQALGPSTDGQEEALPDLPATAGDAANSLPAALAAEALLLAVSAAWIGWAGPPRRAIR